LGYLLQKVSKLRIEELRREQNLSISKEGDILAIDTHYQAPSLEYLRSLGYDAEWVNRPVDIRATKGGKEYWIEVKGTGSEDDGVAFGAATLTEWMCAERNRENFYFLIANKPGIESKEYDESTSTTKWSFELVSPEQMMRFSTISPFQVKFNFPLNNPERRPPNNRETTIVPTWEILESLQDAFESQRKFKSE
jgi:hypothetical protein